MLITVLVLSGVLSAINLVLVLSAHRQIMRQRDLVDELVLICAHLNDANNLDDEE